MKKNEIKNFVKQYKNTVCLDEMLKPVKVLDCIEENSNISCLVMLENGAKSTIPFSDKLIALKGRLKERDYNYIEAHFHRNVHKNG